MLIKELKIRWAYFSLLFFIFIYPIINNNFYFMDDHGHAFLGQHDMLGTGRILSHLIYLFISFSSKFCDPSPLYLLLSVVSLAFTIALLSIEWEYNRLSSIFTLSFIACSPFLLANYSYRFDCFPQTLAICFSLLPFCIERNASKQKKYIWSVFCILCSLNLYQSSISIFLVFSIFTFINSMKNIGFKNSIIEVFNFSIAAISSLLLYKIEIYSLLHYNIIHMTAYAQIRSQITLSPSDIFKNIHQFMKISLSIFSLGKHSGIEKLICFSFITSCIIIEFRSLRYKDFLLACSILLFLILTPIILPGTLIFLKNPPVNMRVMLSNGVFIFAIMSFLLGPKAEFKGIQKFTLPLSGFILFAFFTLSFEWGNMLHAQDELEKNIAYQMVEDIYTISQGKPVLVRLLSHDPQTSTLSPMARIPLRQHKLFRYDFSTIFPRLWGKYELMESNIQSNASILTIDDNYPSFSEKSIYALRSSCAYQTILSRRFYNLYQTKDRIIVDFEKVCPPKSVTTQ